MKTPLIKSKKGFTIIEVSLVLAIGGLIMLMVFIAWPAVQRNQRDSQRKTADLSRVYTALANYQSNNNGKLPSAGGTATGERTFVNGTDIMEGGTTIDTTSKWVKFYKNYLIGNDASENFVDPQLNIAYNLLVIPCSASGTYNKPNIGLKQGASCTAEASVSSTENPTGIEAKIFSKGEIVSTFDDQSATITIVVGAYCSGEEAIAATTDTGGSRKYAVMYRLESGAFCQSN